MAFSAETSQVLQAAVTEAGRRQHPTLEIAHVVLMMTSNPTSAQLMERLGGRPRKLRDELDRYLDDRPRQVVTELGTDPVLANALNRAHWHRVSSKQVEITVEGLLAAIVSEKSSFAVAALARHGVTRFTLTTLLAHGQQTSVRDLPQARLVSRRRSSWGIAKLFKRAPIELCQIVMHNDSFTTMEFVIDVLMSVFDYDREDAVALMQEIHDNGRAPVGDYSVDKAAVLVAEVSIRARRAEFPLAVTVSPFGASGVE